MNHIYKSIFNKALGVFTAVPEFASAHGKGSERTVVGRVAKGTAGFATSALAISIGLALTSTSAVAGPGIYVNDGTDAGCVAYIDTHNSYVGIFGVGAGNSIAMNNSMVKPGYTLIPDSYLALNQMKPCLSSTGANTTEHRSTQTNRTLFYGNNPTASVKDNGAKNLTLGGRLDVNSGIIGVGDRGTNGVGATNSIRMGTGTTLDDTNKHTNAIAIGVNTATTAEGAVAISAEAKARTSYSIAIGRNATAGGDMFSPSNETGSAIAIGRNSLSNFIGAVALGNGATVSPAKSDGNTTDGIAIGTKALVDSYRGMAIGANSQAKGSQSIVLANNVPGAKVSTASGIRSQVYGVESEVSGSNSVAMGSTNTVASDRTYVMGNNINAAANTWDSLAFGTRASVNNSNAIAMGTTASATGTDGAVAIGQNAVSDGKSAITVGYQAYTKGQSSLSIGDNAKANGVAAVAIGFSANAQTADTGKDNTPSTNEMTKGVAIGHFAGADYDGQDNLASVAIGNQAGRYGVGGHNNIAVGSNTGTRVKGSENVAIGSFAGSSEDANPVEVNYTTAVGNQARVKGTYSTAIGVISKAFANSAVALGHDANASHVNSVALGAGSTTADVHTGDYTLNGSYTAAGLPKAANSVVSVGAAGKERQIQNVAAGVISATSTDAINGSQLYATNNYMNNFAGDVATKLGGDAALGNDGHLTMTNIGGTGKDNVNDAIAAANTKVAAGDNITVTSTTGDDGSKTYTVATKKDLVVDSVKAGDTTVNTDGVTIANGPSITKSGGINANGRKVTGVVNGDINPTSTDAVNGSQLHATNTKLDNVANALADTHFVVDTKATTGGELDGTSQADQKIKSGNKVTLQAGKNLKAKQTNGTDGAQVEFSLKDSISLTQVTAGTGANQVVLGNDGVQVGGNTYINKDGLNANSKPISNVADGVKSKDAVNKGQLDAVAQEAAKHTTVKAGKNVEVSEGTNAAGGKEYTVKTADNLNVTSVKAGDSTLNTDGLTITGGPSVKKDGINAGDKKITGVADGNVAAGSKDAVNGGQLAEVKAKADSAVQNVVSANPTALTVTKAGDTVTLTPNFIAGDLVNPATGEVNTPAADDAGKLVTAGTVAKALAETHFVVDTKATTGGELDGASQANQKIKSSNKVTLQAGKNLKAKQTNGTDGAQVEFSLKDSISLTQVTAGTGDNQVVLGKDGVQVGGNTYINKDGINAAGKAISNVANGNVAAYSKDAVNGGQLQDTAKSVADVIGGGATVKDGKVVAGQNGIGNTGQNTVHGAIAAINQNTANNFNQIRGDLRKMDRDLRGSIAGTLATAGLPQAFTPGKSMVAAAAGTYRGQSGLAVGVSRISDNGKVILKVTGNTNSRGDFGGTIGAGYQW